MRRILAAVVASLVLAASGVVSLSADPAHAYSAADFDAGYIISDKEFFDGASMTQAAIQSFLVQQEARCAPTNGSPCLKDYTETTWTRAATPGRCGQYTGAANESAAQIVSKVAALCGINPKVILVTLQKEQGLVTSTAPTPTMYRSAMGWGCPDTAPCATEGYGFYNQVYKAAWQWKVYTATASQWRYRIGAISIPYSPTASCGSSVVNIRNQATANLYNYTPYQPNANAMANLHGASSDRCASYGNRNFWVYYNDWFGSPTGRTSPVGVLDSYTVLPGSLVLSGWAFDPDVSGPMTVNVYVDSVMSSYSTTIPRPDVQALYGLDSPLHGFAMTIPLAAGPHNICVYAINQGPGSNVPISCFDMVSPGGSPFGVVDSLSVSPGKATVTGWAVDPDTASSIPVHVYVDAVGTQTMADQPRADVAAAYPGYGAAHGYSVTVDVPPGTHQICAYGINIGVGANRALRCATVTMPTGSPVGALDYVSAGAGTITVGGWTLDPDTAASIPVHTYVDASGTADTADKTRSDIAALYPGYGSAHGFTTTVAVQPGTHRVCVYGINVAGSGSNQVLGCRTVTSLGGSPFGAVDWVSSTPTSISAGGWAIDPDVADPTTVRLVVDGVATTTTTTISRPDVAALYPAYGASRGFQVTATGVASGQHQVCLVAVNTGSGSDKTLGCSTVTN